MVYLSCTIMDFSDPGETYYVATANIIKSYKYGQSNTTITDKYHVLDAVHDESKRYIHTVKVPYGLGSSIVRGPVCIRVADEYIVVYGYDMCSRVDMQQFISEHKINCGDLGYLVAEKQSLFNVSPLIDAQKSHQNNTKSGVNSNPTNTQAAIDGNSDDAGKKFMNPTSTWEEYMLSAYNENEFGDKNADISLHTKIDDLEARLREIEHKAIPTRY